MSVDHLGHGPRSPSSPGDLEWAPGPPVPDPGRQTFQPPVCAWCTLDHRTADCPSPVCFTCGESHWASKCTNGTCDSCGPNSHDTAYCPHGNKCSRCLGDGHQAWSCLRPWKCLTCLEFGHLRSACPKRDQARPDYCSGYGCKKWDHLKSACPNPNRDLLYCYGCGKLGHHTAWQCVEPPECWTCREHGHWQSDCPMRAVEQPPPPAPGSSSASGSSSSLLALLGWGPSRGGGEEIRGSKRPRMAEDRAASPEHEYDCGP